MNDDLKMPFSLRNLIPCVVLEDWEDLKTDNTENNVKTNNTENNVKNEKTENNVKTETEKTEKTERTEKTENIENTAKTEKTVKTEYTEDWFFKTVFVFPASNCDMIFKTLLTHISYVQFLDLFCQECDIFIILI